MYVEGEKIWFGGREISALRYSIAGNYFRPLGTRKQYKILQSFLPCGINMYAIWQAAHNQYAPVNTGFLPILSIKKYEIQNPGISTADTATKFKYLLPDMFTAFSDSP